VSGWNLLPTEAERRDFVRTVSYHCALFAQVLRLEKGIPSLGCLFHAVRYPMTCVLGGFLFGACRKP
jgi:hypothetical protein